MGHTVVDLLKDYWSTTEQFYMPYYSHTMKRDRFLYILFFLHFTDNKQRDKNDDRLWKLRSLSDIPNDSYARFYNPSEHLAVDEVVALFKGRVIFGQYIPKKHKRFGIKIYKLYDSTGYTYYVRVCLGRDRQNAMQEMTATHANVISLTRRVEGVGHKLFMANFSSPDLFDDLTAKKH
jgi:hypothetical protein